MTDKDFVLSHHPDATSEHSLDTGWTIDTPDKALNWSNRTEDAAWQAAATYLRNGTDPIKLKLEMALPDQAA